MTKTYAVIGDPIDHSLSPALHNAAYLFLGLDCTYIAYRILKGESDYSDLKNAGEVAGNYKFIVNATSVGLKGSGCPIITNNIRRDSIVYDIVYMPIETPLIEQSKNQGATIIYGWEMLLAQAMKS